MKRTPRKLLSTLGACVALAVVVPWPHPGRDLRCQPAAWEVPHGIVAYLYAGYLEDRWARAHLQSRADLERYLHLYGTKQIAPRESCWGHDYVLKPGESFLQYQILWHAPLDVVYDSSERIRVIYTSYE